MKKIRLVMVGNGMAGVRTLEELLKVAPDLYDITVFGAEPHPNYNRIMLSPVLAGEQTLDEIILNPVSWYEENGIRLHLGKKIVSIDRVKRIVTADDGTTAEYDRLLLATGSFPFILPVPGKELDGVIAYRDIADTNQMIEATKTHTHAVVIGGGVLGLEAANGLKVRGMDVTVVHIGPWLMERQLDEVAGRMLQTALEERGLKFLLNAQTDALLDDGSGRVSSVRFKDGSETPADLVVMAAGIRPNTVLAEKAGVLCNRGIVVTDTMQTVTDPRVYAVGECAAHRGVAYGLVAPLYDQAKVCANHLALYGIGRYVGSQVSTKLKVTGIDLFSAGDFMGGADTESIMLADPFSHVYKKLVIKGNKLVGACLYGDTVDGSYYFHLIREGRDISDIRHALMFGEPANDDTEAEHLRQALTLAAEDEVCRCAGVTKGTICEAIDQHGLLSREEISAHTKASTGCGSCAGVVDKLLALATQAHEELTEEPLCGCTNLSEAGLRHAIRDKVLHSASEVRVLLGWRTPCGCATCRPVIQQCLDDIWPTEVHEDPVHKLQAQTPAH